MKNPIFKKGIVTGLAAGLTCFIYIYVLYLLGLNQFGRFKYMFIGIYAIFFVVGLWSFRQQFGGLEWSRALGLGLLINFFGSLTYFIVLYAFMAGTPNNAIERYESEMLLLQKGNQEYLEHEMQKSLELDDITTHNKLKEELDNLNKAYETFKNTEWTPGIMAVDQTFGFAGIGLFLAFLFSLIFKN